MGSGNDSDTTVNFSEDQDFHSLGKNAIADLKQEYLSSAPTATTEEMDIGDRGPTEDIIHYFTLMSSELHYLDIIPKIENFTLMSSTL